MTDKARENFYRTATVIVDHGKEAITAVLDNDLSKRNLTFVDFINQNQHEIYHLSYNRLPCCQCINKIVPLGTPSSRILRENQLDILLDKSGPRLSNHNPRTVSTFCCCLAKPNLSSACLDITLTRCLLINFAVNCRTNPHLKQTIENLIEYRNKMYGHAKEAKITDADYQKYKTDLEVILLKIARFCNFEDRMKQNLLDAEQRPLDSTILLQYHNVLLQDLKQQGDTENKLEEIQQQISTNNSIVQSELIKIDDRITKLEQEGELVAPIPVRDNRLKPRRTCLYVGIAVFTCIVTAGLLFFFFSQRDVTIASNASLLSPHNLTIDTAKKYVYFEVTYPFNISNLNYFPITLTQTSIAVIFNVKLINTTVSSFTLNVPMRSTRKFDVNVGITFSKDNGLAAMASRCNNPEPFFTQFVMIFLTTATYSSLRHQEQTTVNTYPLVDCGNHTNAESLIFLPEYSTLIS